MENAPIDRLERTTITWNMGSHSNPMMREKACWALGPYATLELSLGPYALWPVFARELGLHCFGGMAFANFEDAAAALADLVDAAIPPDGRECSDAQINQMSEIVEKHHGMLMEHDAHAAKRGELGILNSIVAFFKRCRRAP